MEHGFDSRRRYHRQRGCDAITKHRSPSCLISTSAHRATFMAILKDYAAMRAYPTGMPGRISRKSSRACVICSCVSAGTPSKG